MVRVRSVPEATGQTVVPWPLSPVRGLTVSLLLALAGSTTAATDRTPGTVADATFARCRDTHVAVTAFQLPGVTVSGGVLIRYRNTRQPARFLVIPLWWGWSAPPAQARWQQTFEPALSEAGSRPHQLRKSLCQLSCSGAGKWRHRWWSS